MKNKMKKMHYMIILIILVATIIVILFLAPVKSKYETACLSLTFDDGLESHYTTVYPLLKEKDFGATFFIISGVSRFQNKELMTENQIKELIDDGFEIGSHTMTHPFLTELEERDVEAEIRESKRLLEETYDISVDSFAFPYAAYDKEIIGMAKKYYLNLRTMRSSKDSIFLDSFGLESDTSIEHVCGYINLAKNKKLWIIFVFHDIIEEPEVWDTSIEDFKEILDCAENSEILVKSISGCREEVFR